MSPDLSYYWEGGNARSNAKIINGMDTKKTSAFSLGEG